MGTQVRQQKRTKEVPEAVERLAAEMAKLVVEGNWDAMDLQRQVLGWEERWDEWVPFLGLPEEARRAIYTTNAIEGLHRRLKKVIKTRGAFPSDESLLKVLYLAIQDAQKTWGRPSTYWGRARVQLAIHFDLVEA